MFKIDDFLMKKDVIIYNNIALCKLKVGDAFSGRLTVKAVFYPYFMILCEFETLSDNLNSIFSGILLEPDLLEIKFEFEGCKFDNKNINILSYSIEKLTFLLDEILIDKSDNSDFIKGMYFLIPNGAMFRHSTINSQVLVKKVFEKDRVVSSSTYGRSIKYNIDSIEIKITTVIEKTQNYFSNQEHGKLITSTGIAFDEKESISFDSTVKLLENMFDMFSFLNGAYIKPVIFMSFNFDKILIRSNVNSSLNEIRLKSPLVNFNYQSFFNKKNLEKIKENDFYKMYSFVIAHYFSAILSRRTDMIANALGAALERIAHYILIFEEKDNEKLKRNEFLFKSGNEWKREFDIKNENNIGDHEKLKISQYRIYYVLKEMGIAEDINIIKNFISLRNEAVHALNSANSMPLEDQDLAIIKAFTWINDMIYWLFKYDGNMVDHFQEKTSIKTRYKLK